MYRGVASQQGTSQAVSEPKAFVKGHWEQGLTLTWVLLAFPDHCGWPQGAPLSPQSKYTVRAGRGLRVSLTHMDWQCVQAPILTLGGSVSLPTPT
jgi:hypothetical protein